ncbi:MAG: V-type ATP synthase subunit D [Candidatus Altiarchaeota archaeon]|nr:V-type ATP synthase subunit D [Candidatus Altiarchaeota archaeon]
MADIIEGVHPTRMELLEINKKIVLAKKGHKLLKEKRDSLITEFFKIIEQVRGCRDELTTTLTKAYEDLIKAEALMSPDRVEGIASSSRGVGDIHITYGNIVGVKIPKVKLLDGEISKSKGGYDLSFTSSKLDEACDNFDEALKQVIGLIETEESIRRLGEEITKTKRRVNALEYLMIPRLGNTQKYIEMRLEEMERESFFRLKMVKRKREKAG